VIESGLGAFTVACEACSRCFECLILLSRPKAECAPYAANLLNPVA
jgi:hypothetical protein